jgi:CxxC motif-containing protein
MKELTCIVCPMGCSLKIEEGSGAFLAISGNRCPRGAVYAQEEIKAPKRVVTASCASTPQRIPVKSSVPCPRERIPELLADIYKLEVKLPVKTGEALIKNWKRSGIDIVAVRTMENATDGV